MRGASYHELAEVHHDAKASVYEGAGLYEKARKHRRRAERHAFGAREEVAKLWYDPVDSPVEYDADVERAKRQWDPDTADPESDKYDPHSQYVQMLEEVRKSGSYAPRGTRSSPIELDPQEADLENRREVYRSRARRAEEGLRARREVKELARDSYTNFLIRENPSNTESDSLAAHMRLGYSAGSLFMPDLKRRLDADVNDGVEGTYNAIRTLQGVEARARSRMREKK